MSAIQAGAWELTTYCYIEDGSAGSPCGGPRSGPLKREPAARETLPRSRAAAVARYALRCWFAPPTRRILVPQRRQDFRGRHSWFLEWYNEFRPHMTSPERRPTKSITRGRRPISRPGSNHDGAGRPKPLAPNPSLRSMVRPSPCSTWNLHTMLIKNICRSLRSGGQHNPRQLPFPPRSCCALGSEHAVHQPEDRNMPARHASSCETIHPLTSYQESLDQHTPGEYPEAGRSQRSSCHEIVSPQQELSAAAKDSG